MALDAEVRHAGIKHKAEALVPQRVCPAAPVRTRAALLVSACDLDEGEQVRVAISRTQTRRTEAQQHHARHRHST